MAPDFLEPHDKAGEHFPEKSIQMSEQSDMHSDVDPEGRDPRTESLVADYLGQVDVATDPAKYDSSPIRCAVGDEVVAGAKEAVEE